MNCKLSILLSALLLVCLASGCRMDSGASEKDCRTFDRIASRLDSGGSYFMISNPRYLIEGLERDGSRLTTMIAQSDLPREIRDPFVLFSAAFEIGWHLSGIDELEGYGRSSQVFRNDENGRARLFTNRSVLLHKPGAEGALWALDGKTNRPLRPEFEALPVGTAFAADFELHPDAVWQALCRTDRSAGDMDRLSRTMLNMPLKKLLQSVSGEIGVVLFLDDDADPETLQGVHALLVLNDRERFLFQQLGKLARLLPGTKVTANSIVPGPVPGYPELKLQLLWDNSMLFAMLGEETLEKMSSAGRLVETPEFQELAEGLPVEGTGFFYVGAPLFGFFAAALNRQFDDTIAFDSSLPPAGLAVTRREPDGFSTVAHATVDFNQIEFLSEIALPVFTAVAALGEQFDSRRSSIQAEQQLQQCRGGLEAVRNALMKYAAAHGGAFPAQAGIGGLKELFSCGLSPAALVCPGSEDEAAKDAEEFSFDNCSYLYFNGYTKKSNPRLPLLIDWPFNHAGSINVILVDGTIETLQISDADNCRKIVSYLQTRYQYSEEQFRELFRKAAQLDQQFELE